MKTLILFLLISTSHAAIPVISTDGVIGSLSTQEYSETLLMMKDSVDRDLMNLVKPETAQKSVWKLSQIYVGLGLTGEVGVGPYKFGTTLKQRFIYVRSW